MRSLMLMPVLTLILLLILVDFKFHGNICISLDANLGALSSLFTTNTIANGNCDTDISTNTSIYTSMDACSTNAIQLTKYNYNHKCNTETFTNMSTNTSMKNSCQYNTKAFTSTSTNTSTKNSICIRMGTNNYIDKRSKCLLTLMPILPVRLTSILIDVDIKLVSILSAVTR